MIEKKRNFCVFLSLLVSIVGILGLGALSSYAHFREVRRAARARWSVPASGQSVAAMAIEPLRGADT